MLHKPKKRICPLLILRICSNMPRQPEGEKNGSRPSMTSMQANASQSVLLSKPKTISWPGQRLRQRHAWP